MRTSLGMWLCHAYAKELGRRDAAELAASNGARFRDDDLPVNGGNFPPINFSARRHDPPQHDKPAGSNALASRRHLA